MLLRVGVCGQVVQETGESKEEAVCRAKPGEEAGQLRTRLPFCRVIVRAGFARRILAKKAALGPLNVDWNAVVLVGKLSEAVKPAA